MGRHDKDVAECIRRSPPAIAMRDGEVVQEAQHELVGRRLTMPTWRPRAPRGGSCICFTSRSLVERPCCNTARRLGSSSRAATLQALRDARLGNIPGMCYRGCASRQIPGPGPERRQRTGRACRRRRRRRPRSRDGGCPPHLGLPAPPRPTRSTRRTTGSAVWTWMASTRPERKRPVPDGAYTRQVPGCHS